MAMLAGFIGFFGLKFFKNYFRFVLLRKRSCLINAGLSNNCDFRDFITASNARRIWESQTSPGKKRN
ncbi:hypothetical protein BLA29_012048, partial [Euroglyphus maynei]